MGSSKRRGPASVRERARVQYEGHKTSDGGLEPLSHANGPDLRNGLTRRGKDRNDIISSPLCVGVSGREEGWQSDHSGVLRQAEPKPSNGRGPSVYLHPDNTGPLSPPSQHTRCAAGQRWAWLPVVVLRRKGERTRHIIQQDTIMKATVCLLLLILTITKALGGYQKFKNQHHISA
ncbi:hypothetical protein COCON_G00054290 [Conger conger]|uniref:Uncharacterized protein n=1 Tax=Conger conger TaxID=82655 RepID=A0A9Q1DW25_CONCO|nr:hypothetical protein COCON_G00054290 [Conger conger]